jgi:hypothetical protein
MLHNAYTDLFVETSHLPVEQQRERRMKAGLVFVTIKQQERPGTQDDGFDLFETDEHKLVAWGNERGGGHVIAASFVSLNDAARTRLVDVWFEDAAIRDRFIASGLFPWPDPLDTDA